MDKQSTHTHMQIKYKPADEVPEENMNMTPSDPQVYLHRLYIHKHICTHTHIHPHTEAF